MGESLEWQTEPPLRESEETEIKFEDILECVSVLSDPDATPTDCLDEETIFDTLEEAYAYLVKTEN